MRTEDDNLVLVGIGIFICLCVVVICAFVIHAVASPPPLSTDEVHIRCSDGSTHVVITRHGAIVNPNIICGTLQRTTVERSM